MASGDTIATFMAYDNMPPLSGFASFDLRNAVTVYDFDDTTEEAATFLSIIPSNYSAGGINVILHWWATTATTGNVMWSAEFSNLNVNDVDSGIYAAAKTVTTTTNVTSGIESISIISFSNGTELNNILVGNPYLLRIKRVSANIDDTMVGDAELFAIELKEI